MGNSAYLRAPNRFKHKFNGDYEQLKWGGCAMQGWRTSMEDSHIHQTNIDNTGVSVFGIFDGHGGQEVALYVQIHFVEVLKSMPEFKSKDFKNALERTFIILDENMLKEEGIKELIYIKMQDTVSKDLEIYDPSHPDNIEFFNKRPPSLDQVNAGCTANVCLIYQDQLYCANAGDSRSVLGTWSSQQLECLPYEMSFDHKPDNEEEKKRVEAAGGYVGNGRVNGNLSLSRALGDFDYKSDAQLTPDKQLIIALPEIKQKKIEEDDHFLLMGCDGIWECLTNEKLMEFCFQRLQQNSLTDILESLLNEIIAPTTSQGFGCDNMSSILIVFNKKNAMQESSIQLSSSSLQQNNQQQPQSTQQ